ncbi:MAG: hypothetical protein IT182_08600 [Acidobacteria bacterium]|nr:hypothetical protein [Acidobacteriota bacterium]
MLLSLYLLEAGLLLILAPWTQFWDRNYFSALLPRLAAFMTHPYVRGAVTGVGIVSVVAALVEIGVMLTRRRATPHVPGA